MSNESPSLLEAILAARHDLLALAEEQRLTLDELAAWIATPDHQRLLRDLCLLADLQTQLLISRYRLIAASRLIALISPDAEDASDKAKDIARHACVDLLKLELKRAEVEPLRDEGDGPVTPEQVREMLYGPETTPGDAP